MSIGSRIYELRKDSKLSQEKLAEQVGVTRQTISNWELNESSPDLRQSKELSRIFSISLDELVENDIKDILLDKTNKSNTNMHKLNRIMLGVFITMTMFLIVMILTFVTISDAIADNANNKQYNEKHSRIDTIIGVCEVNDEAVFINTPSADFEKIKVVYESQGGKCYDRDNKQVNTKD